LAKYKFKDRDVVIVSSDKDYYQLLNGDRIKQWSPGQKDFVELDKILKKFFIPAHNFCVARCFCGDGSDGIPGIKGAGFKTLAKRFPELCSGEFVSVDEILILNAERLLSSKVQLFHNIDQNQEIPRRNWKLMYLDIKNLSSSQINKIENQVDTFDSVLNKIKFIKLLTREGVENFDFNTFLMTTKSIQ
jgi:5'-3' exonuclease